MRQRKLRLPKSSDYVQHLIRADSIDTVQERHIHELEVHHIELELRNEELKRAMEKIELLLEKYNDLYDFAPVGYFSIDEATTILEANLTAATLMGLERTRLVHRKLLVYLDLPRRPVFLALMKQVFHGGKPETLHCEVIIHVPSNDTRVRCAIRATSKLGLKGAGKWCRIAVTQLDHHALARAHTLTHPPLLLA